MPLTPGVKAIMQARFGSVARFGATRFGYLNPINVVVVINGIDRSKAVDSVRVTLAINDEPDTASFRVEPDAGFSPTPSETVLIGIGSANRLIFGGQIDPIEYTRRQGMLSPWHDVPVIDWQRLFDRRRVTRLWTNTSATAIAAEIIDGFTAGFTRVNVVPDLPTIEHFPAINAKPSALLRQLGVLIGGAYFIDPYRDVHLFGAGGPVRAVTPPLSLTNARVSMVSFRHQNNPNQIRTRVIVEGQGTKVVAEILAGESVLPVETVEMFLPGGGAARVNQELVTYTGLIEGGQGSLVGPGVAPPTAPVATPQAGAGIESGLHFLAFTWVTGSGETLPSPLGSVTLGLISPPVTTPSRAAVAGSELNSGTYQYAVTFVVGAGETTPGPSGSVVTSDGIQPPGSSPTATATQIDEHFGGRYNVGDSVWCRCSYVDVDGNETGGTDSNTVTVLSVPFGSGVGAVAFSNLPVPSDPNVAFKRLYLNVNGGFSAYVDIANGQTGTVWNYAGNGTGSFPIGGSPLRRRVSLTSIAVGPSGTTARKIYRTVVNGSALKLVTTISDNSTTTYTDSTADGSLGADAPSSNTATLNQAALTAIAVGPSGVTSRKVYRTVAGGAQLKLVTTIADNSTTTYSDSTADGSLGANAPSGDTSGLTQPTGQVNAGSSSLLVAGPGAFSTGGGWAIVGGQTIRYTGISGQSLTGIPATGLNALRSSVTYGTTIIEAPRLTGVAGLTRDVARGAAVVLRVTRNDLVAQAAQAVAEGGDGIHEHVIKDDQLSAESAGALADAELAAFSRPLVSAEWETEDRNAVVGRPQAIALTGPTFDAELTITRVEISFPAPNQAPRRRCQASTVKTAELLDVVATD